MMQKTNSPLTRGGPDTWQEPKEQLVPTSGAGEHTVKRGHQRAVWFELTSVVLRISKGEHQQQTSLVLAPRTVQYLPVLRSQLAPRHVDLSLMRILPQM